MAADWPILLQVLKKSLTDFECCCFFIRRSIFFKLTKSMFFK